MPHDLPLALRLERVRAVAENALKQPITRLEQLQGPLYRTFILQTTSSQTYVLRCAPVRNIRLLRGEAKHLESEVDALRMLGSRLPDPPVRLVEWDATPVHLGSKYLISGPFSGVPLSTLLPSLSTTVNSTVQQSLLRYLHILTLFLAPPNTISGSRNTSHAPSFGFIYQSSILHPTLHTWSKTYAILVDTTLRDAEDARINLPYDSIRVAVRTHRAALDRYTTPRLLLLHDVAAAHNLMVDPATGTVTGVLDWSSAMFGDPEMSSCYFYSGATASHKDGNASTAMHGHEADREARNIRRGLYAVYHSVVSITRQHYRPDQTGKGEADTELEARKVLTDTLRALHEVRALDE